MTDLDDDLIDFLLLGNPYSENVYSPHDLHNDFQHGDLLPTQCFNTDDVSFLSPPHYQHSTINYTSLEPMNEDASRTEETSSISIEKGKRKAEKMYANDSIGNSTPLKEYSGNDPKSLKMDVSTSQDLNYEQMDTTQFLETQSRKFPRDQSSKELTPSVFNRIESVIDDTLPKYFSLTAFSGGDLDEERQTLQSIEEPIFLIANNETTSFNEPSSSLSQNSDHSVPTNYENLTLSEKNKLCVENFLEDMSINVSQVFEHFRFSNKKLKSVIRSRIKEKNVILMDLPLSLYNLEASEPQYIFYHFKTNSFNTFIFENLFLSSANFTEKIYKNAPVHLFFSLYAVKCEKIAYKNKKARQTDTKFINGTFSSVDGQDTEIFTLSSDKTKNQSYTGETPKPLDQIFEKNLCTQVESTCTEHTTTPAISKPDNLSLGIEKKVEFLKNLIALILKVQLEAQLREEFYENLSYFIDFFVNMRNICQWNKTQPTLKFFPFFEIGFFDEKYCSIIKDNICKLNDRSPILRKMKTIYLHFPKNNIASVPQFIESDIGVFRMVACKGFLPSQRTNCIFRLKKGHGFLFDCVYKQGSSYLPRNCFSFFYLEKFLHFTGAIYELGA